MTIEKLKELLESGAITQEEFDEMAKNFEPAPNPEPNPEPAPKDPEPTDDEKFEKLFQSKFDRAMAQERKKTAELQKKYDRLQKQMLTEDEAKQLEIEEQKKEIEEQRRALTLEKNKMYAVKAMKKAEISDSEETVALIEKLVVSCEDELDIDDTIKVLKSWYEKGVKAEVDRRFKQDGYTPKKSETLNGGVNPFAEGQINLTEQMRIEATNPELAKQLKAMAGVK